MFSDWLAGLPRACRSRWGCLRKFRESAEAVRRVCGALARLPERFLALAGVPRSRPCPPARLRTSRERAKAYSLPRGTPASVAGGGRESLWFLRPFGSKRPFGVERDIPFIYRSRFDDRLTHSSVQMTTLNRLKSEAGTDKVVVVLNAGVPVAVVGGEEPRAFGNFLRTRPVAARLQAYVRSSISL